MEARTEEERLLTLSHQRQTVHMEYNQRVQKLALYGKQLVYPNQKEAACETREHFSNGVIMVVLIAQPGVGKTGCVLEVSYIMATHPDDDIIVEADKIYTHCGMNDLEWNEQYRRNMLPSLSLNVAHRSTIKNFIKPLREAKNSFVSTDEAHIASGKKMTESKTLKEAGILNLENLSSKNNKILRISATPEGVLEEIKNHWEDKAAVVILKPGPMYKGFQVMLDEQRIRQAPNLQSELDVANFLNIFETRYHGYPKRFFPMRGLNADILNHIYTIANRMNWKIIHHDSNETIENIDELMSTSPVNHTIIVIKEYWRASKRVKRDHIGGTYEKPPKTPNTSVTAQGLTARICDNYEYTGEWLNPDLRPLLYCDLVAIKQYLDWFNNSCDYARVKYKSKYINSDGKRNVKARHSLMHPSNVDGLEEREYEPENTPTVDSYQMSELFLTSLIASEWADNHINWGGEWNTIRSTPQLSSWNVTPCNPDGSPGNTHIRYGGEAHVIVTESEFRHQGNFSRFGAGVRCVPIKTGDTLSYTIVYKTSWLR